MRGRARARVVSDALTMADNHVVYKNGPYLNYARTEQSLFDKVVTDWERTRYFERG